MAFEPKKIDLNAINGNSEYKKGDALQPSAVNEMVKGILYAQENGGSGTNIEIDSELSLESENAVQNKVVAEALNKKLEEEDLTNYVKNTDVSKDGKTGLMALYGENKGYGYGLYNRGGQIYILPAGNGDINTRTVESNPTSSLNNASKFKPITRATIDYAVKKVLTEDKLATTDYAWTDEEKALARATLGITSGTKFYAHKFYKDFDVYTIISTSPNLQYAYFLNGDDPDTGVSDANFGMIINTGYILDAYKEIEDINYMEPQLVKSAEGYKTDIRTFLLGYAERYVNGIYELAGENVSSIFSEDYYGSPLESDMWEDYTGNEFEGIQNIKVIKPDYTSEL